MDFGGLLLVALDDLALVRRGQNIGQGNGDTGAGCPVETGILDPVKRCGNLHLRVALGEVVDDRRELALVCNSLDVRVVRRQSLVEECTTEGRLQQVRLVCDKVLRSATINEMQTAQSDANLCIQIQRMLVECQDRLGDG